MASTSRIQLPGTDPPSVIAAATVARLDPTQVLQVPLRIRYPRSAPPIDQVAQAIQEGREEIWTREQFAHVYGADPSDVAATSRYLRHYGVKVLAVDRVTRNLTLEGTVADLEAAFGAPLSQITTASGKSFHSHGAALSLGRRAGASISNTDVQRAAEAIETVGLHTHPRRNYISPEAVVTPGVTFDPDELAGYLKFPGADGKANPFLDCKGVNVAHVQLDGGFNQADIDQMFDVVLKGRAGKPTAVFHSVGGSANTPTGDINSADPEWMLDMTTTGGAAPNCTLNEYKGPNTGTWFATTVRAAIHDKVAKNVAVGVSWGSSLANNTTADYRDMRNAGAEATVVGVSLSCATGDNGSTDDPAAPDWTKATQDVDVPAACPTWTGIGGVTITRSPGGKDSIVIWGNPNAGGKERQGEGEGAGINTQEPVPAWQAPFNHAVSANPPHTDTGFSVVQVTLDADPHTGINLIFAGKPIAFGGTSAGPPQITALVARLAALHGKSVGDLNAFLSRHPDVADPIVSGSNGAYSADGKWSVAGGFGLPDGERVSAAFVKELTGTRPLDVTGRRVATLPAATTATPDGPDGVG